MPRVAVARLEKLANYLKQVPEERFDMSTWAEKGFCGTPVEPHLAPCGTSACALGWACTMPVFQKLGLRLANPRMATPYPVYGAHSGLQAAIALFHLAEEDADKLFLQLGDKSTVVKRLEKFIARTRRTP